MLRERGVKNNKFMLTLYDPSLVGVDPYDPNLSDAMKFKIQKEVINISITVRGMGNVMMSGQLQVEKGATAYSVLKQLASQNGQTISRKAKAAN